MAKVLVVDDKESFRRFLVEALEGAGHDVGEAAEGQEAVLKLKQRAWHVLVTDLKMPRMGGEELLKWVRANQPEVEVIVLTAHGSVSAAVEAMKRGAFDFLEKPLESPEALRLLVARAAESHALKATVERSSRQGGDEEVALGYGDPAMTPVVNALARVASTDSTVLLEGESGVGKEVAARFIHRNSGRAGGPFVVVNCAALSDTLLESELFGHEKGAFTGAEARRRGRIELADGGTFFLDEVGELKPALQAKLLRVLQEKSFQKVGGDRTIDVDVRWVAATNRDLKAMCAQGAFREDLYHRLAVFPVRLPPLRERPADIAPLAGRLLSSIAARLGRPGLALGGDALEALGAYSWPGNIRELANTLERAAIMGDGAVITRADLGMAGVRTGEEAAPALHRSSAETGGAADVLELSELEKEAISRALDSVGGNRKQAAKLLGIGLRTLYDKLKRYRIG